MEVVYEYCCGLDIHKKTVVACVVVPGPGKQPHKEIRTFNTMTADLLELIEFLVDPHELEPGRRVLLVWDGLPATSSRNSATTVSRIRN